MNKAHKAEEILNYLVSYAKCPYCQNIAGYFFNRETEVFTEDCKFCPASQYDLIRVTVTEGVR